MRTYAYLFQSSPGRKAGRYGTGPPGDEWATSRVSILARP